MDIVFQWIGSLALLGILFLVVPAIFMLIITLQYRFIEHKPVPMPSVRTDGKHSQEQ